MNDTRSLSIVSFRLFVASLVLPWPIAAIGPNEYALIFAGVSLLLAVTLAVLSYRELFSRIVLVGVTLLLLLLMVVALVMPRRATPATESVRTGAVADPTLRSPTRVSTKTLDQ